MDTYYQVSFGTFYVSTSPDGLVTIYLEFDDNFIPGDEPISLFTFAEGEPFPNIVISSIETTCLYIDGAGEYYNVQGAEMGNSFSLIFEASSCYDEANMLSWAVSLLLL